MNRDGLTLIQPIPRRPFLKLASLNTGKEDPAADSFISDENLNNNSGHGHGNPDSLSRAASFMNLTTSTLFGIYAAPASPGDDQDYFDEREEREVDGTWGTEPQEQDDGDEQKSAAWTGSDPSAKNERLSLARNASLSSVASRVVLLFVLGMGYGVLVTRLPSKQNLTSFGVDELIDSALDWRYLTLWGVAGVALGSLLPWFDGVWERTFGRYGSSGPVSTERRGQSMSQDMDWALVIRGIGAFVGIVFAIRRLPWASTMQVSLTLGLASPFMWYLIDRSKPGLLLSTTVALTGSAVLVMLNPNVLPAPTSHASSANATAGNSQAHAVPQLASSVLGGLADQETLEAGIWMLSVLFCSCVCFGNIGRRLAPNTSATARGRWAGIR